MVENIIFDFGGVLVNFAPRTFLKETFHDVHLENAIYNLTFGDPLWAQMDADTVTREEAEDTFLQLAALQGLEKETALILKTWKSTLTLKKDTYSLLQRLAKSNYHTYYLSNLPADCYEDWKTRFDFWQYFDGGIVSCDVKCIKPDAEIFDILLEKYNLKAETCVFTDDSANNVQGAQACGLKGIVFTGAKELEEELKKLGVSF
ncbi:MAG: HAD family phosphatase [Oscillospiraceae bacterium]|nr:HAD family phosphatase [Oscillospiraceae bacterium]